VKVLVYTCGGDGLAIAWRLKKAGHEVDCCLTEKTKAGRGLVNLVKNPEPKKYDLVVCNGRDFCEFAERVAAPTVGPSAAATRLEVDRAYGMRMMEAHGIQTPEWQLFHKLDAAKKFATDYGKPLVLKPNGKKAASMLTIVADRDDNEDLLSLLDLAVRHNPDLEREGFLLQQKIVGIEMSAGSFFNGVTWTQPVMVNFEHKKLAPQPWPGPATGEMGSAAFWAYSPKLFREVTEKMTPHLREIGYRGDFDVNTIITPKGPYALEMTPRIGFPAVCLQMSNYKGDFGDFLWHVAKGKAAPFHPVAKWAVGVLLTCPPFPYEEMIEDDDAFIDIPIYGEFTKDIYPLDVDVQKDAYYSSGSGWVAVACGGGDTLSAAKEEAYKRLRTIKVTNGLARSDIGDRVEKERDTLEKGGWM